jgi:hypothetical protein
MARHGDMKVVISRWSGFESSISDKLSRTFGRGKLSHCRISVAGDLRFHL